MRLTEEECQLELDFICKELSLTVVEPLKFDYDTEGYECIVRDENLKGVKEVEEKIDSLDRQYNLNCMSSCYDWNTHELIGYQLQIFKID